MVVLLKRGFNKPPSGLPGQTQSSTRDLAGFGVISGKLAHQSSIRGCGFDSGTREPRAPTGLIQTSVKRQTIYLTRI